MAPKVVVITGCSTGIGLETAVLLAGDKENRFKVFATMRNLAKQAQLEIAARSTLDKTLFIRELDVTKEDAIEEFIEKLNREEGGVDILINNAGIGQFGLVEKVTLQQTRAIYETNVFGLIRLTQAVIPGMKAKKSGHIINVTSLCGLSGMNFVDIYVSSKFAVEGFSESLAPYLLQFNISVSVVEPGPVQTAFVENIGSNNLGHFGGSDPDADEFTQELQKKNTAATMKWLSPLMQTGKDIARVIQEAILSDKPHLRYPTSKGVTALVALKYKDPAGDSIIKAIVEQNGWAQ